MDGEGLPHEPVTMSSDRRMSNIIVRVFLTRKKGEGLTWPSRQLRLCPSKAVCWGPPGLGIKIPQGRVQNQTGPEL